MHQREAAAGFDAVPELLLLAALLDVDAVGITDGYPYRAACLGAFGQEIVEPRIRFVEEDRRVHQDVDAFARRREQVDEHRRRDICSLVIERNEFGADSSGRTRLL
ncbi:hypothetical protein [Nocardia asteroides]